MARLERRSPKLMIVAPERHIRRRSHPLEIIKLTKMLPLHVMPLPIVPMSETMAYCSRASTIVLFDDV